MKRQITLWHVSPDLTFEDRRNLTVRTKKDETVCPICDGPINPNDSKCMTCDIKLEPRGPQKVCTCRDDSGASSDCMVHPREPHTALIAAIQRLRNAAPTDSDRIRCEVWTDDIHLVLEALKGQQRAETAEAEVARLTAENAELHGKECAHGHKQRVSGCVSCVMVFDWGKD